MIGHEASFSAPREFRGDVNPEFKAESKNAGWIDRYGKAFPVIRHANKRIAESYTTDLKGMPAVWVSEYYALAPRDEPLKLIPGEEVAGHAGQEIKVSFALPIDKANKLKFSHSHIETAQVISMGRISAKPA